MFKKLFIFANTILTLSAATAFAASVGPYVGIGGGADDSAWHAGHNSTISVTDIFGTETFTTGSSKDMGAHGFVGTVFGGYSGIVCSDIYLAGEIFGNIASTSANVRSSFTDVDPLTGTTSLSVSDTLKTKYGYGVSFIPGVVLNNSVIGYGRIGYIRTRFEHSLSISGTDPTGPFASSRSTYNNINGGQLGLGVRVNTAPGFDIRGEYTYTAYQGYSSLGERIIPRNNQVTFGLAYNFC